MHNIMIISGIGSSKFTSMSSFQTAIGHGNICRHIPCYQTHKFLMKRQYPKKGYLQSNVSI